MQLVAEIIHSVHYRQLFTYVSKISNVIFYHYFRLKYFKLLEALVHVILKVLMRF